MSAPWSRPSRILAACLLSCLALGASAWAHEPVQELDGFAVGAYALIGNANWCAVSKIYNDHTLDLAGCTKKPLQHLGVSTSEPARRTAPDGFLLDEEVAYQHSARKVLGSYLEGGIALEGVDARIPLSEVAKLKTELNGFVKGAYVLYQSDIWCQVARVYDDQAIDLAGCNKSPNQRAAVSGSLVARQLDPVGFKIDEQVAYEHSVRKILGTYPDGSVALDGVKFPIQVGDIAKLRIELNGFTKGAYVLYQSDIWCRVAQVYDDQALDLVGCNKSPNQRAAVSGSLVARQLDPVGFKIDEQVAYEHSVRKILGTYPDGSVALDGVKTPVQVGDLAKLKTELNGFVKGAYVLYQSDIWCRVAQVYDDQALDLVGCDKSPNQRGAVNGSELARQLDPIGFKISEQVAYEHSVRKIIGTYPDGSVALDGVKAPVQVGDIAKLKTELNGFVKAAYVLYQTDNWCRVGQVYDDQTVDLNSCTRAPNQHNTVSMTEVARLVDPGNGFKINQGVAYSHSVRKILATYPDGTVALNGVRLQVGISEISIPKTEIDGFVVGAYALFQGSIRCRISQVYEDHTVDLISCDKTPTQHSALSTATVARLIDPGNGYKLNELVSYQGALLPIIGSYFDGSLALQGVKNPVDQRVLPARPNQPATNATADATKFAPATQQPAAQTQPQKFAAKAGEIAEINGSAPLYGQLTAPVFPADLAKQGTDGPLEGEEVDAIAAEISKCGVSIAGPSCLEGRFRSKDGGWIAQTSSGQQAFFGKAFVDTQRANRILMTVYESEAAGTPVASTSAYIFGAPDSTAGLDKFYGLFADGSVRTPAVSFSVPRETGRAALDALKSASEPSLVYHTLAAVLATRDASLISGALENVGSRAEEMIAKSSPAYRAAFQRLNVNQITSLDKATAQRLTDALGKAQ